MATRVAVRAGAAGVVSAASRWWRRRLTGRAIDATAAVTGRRLLVLAPHPDDETFGCGALIARAVAAGDPVTVVVATDGSRSATSRRFGPDEIAALRRDELRTACGQLGVRADTIIELGYGDGTLAERLTELTADVSNLVKDLRPDIVLVPCGQDQHPDHRALHDAAVTAVDGAVLLAYPIWAWHAAPIFLDARVTARLPLWAWSLRQAAVGRWWRVPAGPHLDQKRSAIDAYASQVSNYTGEADWSYLPPEFVAAFLASDELFLPR